MRKVVKRLGNRGPGASRAPAPRLLPLLWPSNPPRWGLDLELLDQPEQVGALQAQGLGSSCSVPAVLREASFEKEPLEVAYRLVEPAPAHQGRGLRPAGAGGSASFAVSSATCAFSAATELAGRSVRNFRALSSKSGMNCTSSAVSQNFFILTGMTAS